MLILLIIAVMSVIFSIYSKDELSTRQRYNKYMSALSLNNVANETQTPSKVIVPADNTVDINKVNSDIKTGESLLTDIFTFSNGEEYDADRDKLISLFGADADVVKSVFTENVKTNVDGKEYNYVDTHGVNMKVANIRTYPTNITSNGNNKYLSCVSFSLNRKDNASISYMLSVQYSIDKYGSMTDCDVYMLRTKY